MAINFWATKKDAALIQKIVQRALRESPDLQKFGRLNLEMSLTAYHLNDRPMRLQGMLAGRLFDLLHDLVGIHQTISHETGKVVGVFLPRYAQK